VVSEKSWSRPPIFDLIASSGVERDEMFATFNMGVGMVVVLAEPESASALKFLANRSLQAWKIGRIEGGPGEPGAIIEP
jgi:phosphoribosylformylglycinamidine cyclo-ligase